METCTREVTRTSQQSYNGGCLPVKQDRLDQGDNVPAGIISGTDNSNVDCLGRKQKQGEQLRQVGWGLPGASDHTEKKNRPYFLSRSLENRGRELQLWKITRDSFI